MTVRFRPSGYAQWWLLKNTGECRFAVDKLSLPGDDISIHPFGRWSFVGFMCILIRDTFPDGLFAKNNMFRKSSVQK